MLRRALDRLRLAGDQRAAGAAGWLLLWLALTWELVRDPLRILKPTFKQGFQADSEYIVIVTMSLDRALLDPMVQYVGEPYSSQFGLQGIVAAALSDGTALVAGFHWVTAGLLALCLVAATAAVQRTMGWVAAAVLLVLLVLTPVTNAFAPNLYWQLWTMLLPTVAPLLLWPRLGAGRGRWVWGGLLVAALVMLKALCGYEFITTVILGAVAAVAFHEFRDRFDRRLLARLSLPLLSGIAGFGAALVVHQVQLRSFLGDGAAVEGRAGERTFSPSNLDELARNARPVAGPLTRWLIDHVEPLGLWVFGMEHYLGEPALALPARLGFGPVPYGIPIWLLVLVAGWLVVSAFRRPGASAVERRLAVATVVALSAGLSWLVLGFGHMVNHHHVDSVVFALPFLPFAYALVGLRVAGLVRRRSASPDVLEQRGPRRAHASPPAPVAR